ncbi:MAG TPA: GNAT family N-acetyltransferase [Stellaceae bacterium]|nr:GNAT family N-acetyltransferase [Stellaceae bacterium]
MLIRPALPEDRDAIWRVLEPTIRAGETYALPRDMSAADAVAYWLSPGHEAFVAEEEERVVGTYFLRANPQAGPDVANCGYVTALEATGRGVARRMAEHSFAQARERGFAAMQYNFVVSTNERAVALWRGLGFMTVGRLERAFDHPRFGSVDALVMSRPL